jgi:hypothetical protein
MWFSKAVWSRFCWHIHHRKTGEDENQRQALHNRTFLLNMEHTELVGLYFAVIHKATIHVLLLQKPYSWRLPIPFISEQCMEESKTSRLHCGLLAMHSHCLPRSCAALGAIFNTAVSKVLQRIYQKEKCISHGCQMKPCAVCCPLFVRMNTTDSL